MMTQQAITELKDKTNERIQLMSEKVRSVVFGSPEWESYNIEYHRQVAKYNVLLEVLK